MRTELAYLAGFFDGEGCISIACSKSQNGHRHELVIHIVSTDWSACEAFRKALGGAIYETKPRAAKRRTQWRWCLQGSSVPDALQRLYPFLRLERKRQAAKIAMEFSKVGRRAIPYFARY